MTKRLRRRLSALAGAALIAALVLSAAPLRAETPAVPRIAPAASEFTLDNGLSVVVVPDRRAPVVTQMVWYRVGSADDPVGKSGIAHFLEHLMFKGTKTHPAGVFSAEVAEIGGNENAFTTDDATVYHQTVPKEQLGLVMGFEADRMANLVLDDAAVLPERDVILEERRMRVDSDPAAQLGEAVDAALYQRHPYGTPVIGWAHEMAELSREDAITFYDRAYTPNNAILVVAGDVDEEEVRVLAEATYGKVARRAAPAPRDRAKEPEPVAARAVTLSDPRVAQPSLQRRYLVPSYASATGREAEALDVLADILGGGTESRLYRKLVRGAAIATSAGVWYSGSQLDYGSFGLSASPRGATTLDTLAAAIDGVIADLRDRGITEDELARAKRRTRAGAIYAQDSSRGLANYLGTALLTGESLAKAQDYPARIEAVTAEDVRAAAEKYLDLKRSVTGYLLPAPAAKPI
ncbi:pitrilysin family protein [Prosthecomicrobium pneumaticum]|uniref:Zinc protease n=1 Tax=Prosthecomicrobium pneumaticum TaxID=81895 RepID=A0A7W9CV20_9HYPH|nr:zinc protease [Prosthecomicrobium pneumaticum]